MYRQVLCTHNANLSTHVDLCCPEILALESVEDAADRGCAPFPSGVASEYRTQGLGTKGVSRENTPLPVRLQRPLYYWCQGRAAPFLFQRQLVLTVGFIISGPRDLPRERLGGSMRLGLVSGVAFEESALAKRGSAGGFVFVCSFVAFSSLPKLTSLIGYKYSVLKQMTNFRYT